MKKTPLKKELHDQYFEAILQLRPADDAILGFVLDTIEANPRVHIAKTVPHKNGLDLYLSSNAFTKNIGYQLKRRFKGTLTLSRTLHTQDRMTSKNLYRVTVLFRAQPKE